MKQIIIDGSFSGQRLDRVLKKYLVNATDGFIYKMLRKKNIKLNDSGAKGKEILNQGDIISIYFSDETLDKFTGRSASPDATKKQPIPPLKKDEIIYEDDDILIMDKPVGELSQKADKKDISINERMLSYLGKNDAQEDDISFKPGIANRLDRNTSGIVLAGKTLQGARLLSEFIRHRTIKKYYLALLDGKPDLKKDKPVTVEAYIIKDKKTNIVSVFDEKTDGAVPIKMKYRPADETMKKTYKNYCKNNDINDELSGDKTLVEVELITGKTHQIRAYFSYISHPLSGDAKYGSGSVKDYKNKSFYFLRAYKIVMPEDERISETIRGKTIYADRN